MAFCGDASAFSKIAALLLLAALCSHIAGFATKDWQHSETIQQKVVLSIGLWRATDCSGSNTAACTGTSVPSAYVDTAFKATRAFQSIVLVVLVVTAMLAILYVASERFRTGKHAILLIVLCFGIVLLAIIGMIIWIAQVPSNHYPGYSFGLAVLAFIMAGVAGILYIPDVRRYTNQRRQARHAHVQKVEPSPREDFSKYDHVRNEKYGRQTPPTYHGDDYQKAPRRGDDTGDARHYYNPNRDRHNLSPPPKYQSRGYTPDFDLPETPRQPRRF